MSRPWALTLFLVLLVGCNVEDDPYEDGGVPKGVDVAVPGDMWPQEDVRPQSDLRRRDVAMSRDFRPRSDLSIPDHPLLEDAWPLEDTLLQRDVRPPWDRRPFDDLPLWEEMDMAPCVPSCGDRECGEDGCGGSCGSCSGHDICQRGQCRPVACNGALPGYCFIPPGTFTMGSAEGQPGRDLDEGPQHEVAITRGFYLKATEVTQAEWVDLMGNNPTHNRDHFYWGLPVEYVNWWEAASYCNGLSTEEGLEPCYDLSGCVGRPGAGLRCEEATFHSLDCPGYRLPTEAEWEYGARGGTQTPFYNGDILHTGCYDPSLSRIGWYCGNTSHDTERVAQKEPNAWGLYDMSGNVWEWVWDWYGNDVYPTEGLMDPLGPEGGQYRARRGGSYDDGAEACRSANRCRVDPDARQEKMGFRPARTIPPCATEADCPPVAPLCRHGHCVECLSDGDCPTCSSACSAAGVCEARESNCDDNLDEDCDGLTDCQDWDCQGLPVCVVCEAWENDCFDGLDDDCDGNIDCQDSQCQSSPPCRTSEVCDDGLDNDGDGDVDCADRDCIHDHACPCTGGPEDNEGACSDGCDNDGDWAIDCDDGDCRDTETCFVPQENTDEACQDGLDNDGDGYIDCQDWNCHRTTVCATGEEENTDQACEDGRDNDGDGYIDCDDWDCDCALACNGPGCDSQCAPGPEDTDEACSDGCSNDGDSYIDCDDFDCECALACGGWGCDVCRPVPEDTDEACSDGCSNDGDSYIDCDDSDCHCSLACGGPGCDGCPAGPEDTDAACEDGCSNDGDSYIDCDDFDCVCALACGGLGCEDCSGPDVVIIRGPARVYANMLEAAIPDNDALGATTMVLIDEADIVDDLQVYLRIDHPRVTDLVVTLESPSGARDIIHQGTANPQGGLVNIEGWYDDEGMRPKAVYPLANFDGEEILGLWTLTVVDMAAGSTGILVEWRIELGHPTPVEVGGVPNDPPFEWVGRCGADRFWWASDAMPDTSGPGSLETSDLWSGDHDLSVLHTFFVIGGDGVSFSAPTARMFEFVDEW